MSGNVRAQGPRTRGPVGFGVRLQKEKKKCGEKHRGRKTRRHRTGVEGSAAYEMYGLLSHGVETFARLFQVGNVEISNDNGNKPQFSQ